MRAVVVVCMLGAAAHAEPFVEVAGGVADPLGDSNWTRKAATSPTFGARAGWMMPDGLGALVQADWTPENLPASTTIPIPAPRVTLHRFRVLADAVFEEHLGSRWTTRVRAGIGVDIIREELSESVGASPVTTDPNLALEIGIGSWCQIARHVAIGAELALAFANHSRAMGSPPAIPANMLFAEQYTSLDLEAELGVRVAF